MSVLRPRLFAELCCGSAAVTLQLLGGPKCRPPVSYMGSKRGYAHAILASLGLEPGQGADAVLLVDPGPWSRVWAVLAQPGGCAQVAATIRSWAGEEPRALWNRLRAEGPLDGSDAARWLLCHRWSFGERGPEHGYGGPGCIVRAPGTNWTTENRDAALERPKLAAAIEQLPEGVARYLMIAASNRLINVDYSDGRWQNTGKGGTTHGGAEFATPAARLADASEAAGRVAWPPALVGTLPAEQVDPREVAAWLLTAAWCYRRGEPASGFRNDVTRGKPVTATDHGASARTVDLEAGLVERSAAAWPDTALYVGSAEDVKPAPDLSGCVVYIDPPYATSTGYRHTLSRDAVLALARRWDACGATVCVSEAEPLDPLGWHAREITATRKGQKRTFSKQQAEWLTCNRPFHPLPEPVPAKARRRALTDDTPSGSPPAPVQSGSSLSDPPDNPVQSSPRDFPSQPRPTSHTVPAPTHPTIPSLPTPGVRMPAPASAKPLPPVTITRVTGTVKGARDVELSPRTLIVGKNRRGKTAILNTITLACAKFADDVRGRRNVAAPALLIALGPRVGPLVARCELSNQTVASYETERRADGSVAQPKCIQPMAFNFPMRAVAENLTGSVDRAREWLLSMVAGTVTRADVHARLGDPSLSEVYDRAAAATGKADEVGVLLAVAENAGVAKRRHRDLAEAHRAAARQQAAALGPMPTEEQLAEVSARCTAARQQSDASLGRRALEGAVIDAGARLAVARQEAEEVVAAYQSAQIREAGLQMVAPDARPAEDGQAAIRAALAATLEFHAENRAAVCLCCDGGLGPVQWESARARAGALRAVDANRDRLVAAWAEHAAAAAESARLFDAANAAVLRLGEAEAREAEARTALAAVPEPDARDAFAAAIETYQRVSTLRGAWLAVRQHEAGAADEERAVEDATRLEAALAKVVGDLLDAAVARFEAEVQAHLPAGDVFRLRLRAPVGDAGEVREVCEFGLERDDGGTPVLDTALCGLEEVRVYLAMAAAAFEGEAAKPGVVNVYVTPDRAYDEDALRETMVALRDVPGQVIVTSTIDPAGKLPAGWTRVYLGDDDPRARKRALGSASPSGELPDTEPASAGGTPTNGHADAVAAPAEELPPDRAPNPLLDGALPPRATWEAALAARAWAPEKLARMNPNAMAVALADGLVGTDYTVVSGGTLFDVHGQRMLAETMPLVQVRESLRAGLAARLAEAASGGEVSP